MCGNKNKNWQNLMPCFMKCPTCFSMSSVWIEYDKNIVKMSYVQFPPGLAALNTFIVSQKVSVITAIETASYIIFYCDKRG